MSFCFFLSLTISAQSVFDKNTISGDDLREMILEVFESRDGETLLQVDAENGQDILLLINSSSFRLPVDGDVRTALIDLKNNPYDLNITTPVQILEETEQGRVSEAEILRAINLRITRNENKVTLSLDRRDVSEKKWYRLFAFFEKSEESWTLITQNFTIVP